MSSDEEKLKLARALDVRDIGLSVRVVNAFHVAALKGWANIKTVGDLMDTHERELMRLRNIGVRSRREIRDALHSLGLRMKGEPCPTCQGRGWLP